MIEFLDKLGYDVVDAGPLSEGWRFQRDTAAYVTPYGAPDDVTQAQTADADTIKTALGQAKRYREMAE